MSGDYIPEPEFPDPDLLAEPTPDDLQADDNAMLASALAMGGQLVQHDAQPIGPEWLSKLGATFCRVYPNDKKPIGNGWQDNPLTWAQVKQHVDKGGNVGLICGQHSGGLFLLDIDDGLSAFLAEFPAWADYPRIERGQADKAKIILKLVGDWQGEKKYKKTPQDKHPFLEILWTGNQGVIPPSRHPSGDLYRYVNPGQPIREITPADLLATVTTWADIYRHPTPTSDQAPTVADRSEHDNGTGPDLRESVRAYWTPLTVFERFGLASNGTKKEREWIRILGNGGLFAHADGVTWNRPGDGPGAGGDVFDAWYFCETGGYKIPAAEFRPTLLKMAQAAGIPVPASDGTRKKTTRKAAPAATVAGDQAQASDPGQGVTNPYFVAECLGRGETGDAELFNALFENSVKFDRLEKQFYTWQAGRWAPDSAARVVLLVQNELASQYLQAAADVRKKGSDPETVELADLYHKRGKALLARKRITNVLALVESQPAIRLLGTEWDIDPLNLPVKNGLIDLRTGDFRPATPADYIRDFSPVEWRGLNEPAPIWEKTLLEIFNGDPELVGFIRRLFGYGLTGLTREQVLPILYGDGANGKSTLLEILAAVLGASFGGPTSADAIMDSKFSDGNQATPYVFAMRGKRLVWASESKEGQRLNTGLVKMLTGDNLITARPLHGNPVTFQQTHKIMLITNHPPRIPDADDYAIWRRVLRIPFDVRFVDNPRQANERKINKALPELLKAEFSGILAWLVRGCLEWQKSGLMIPAAVLESTEKYRDDEDLVGQFADERLITRPGAEVMAGTIYKDYVSWCEKYGYTAMSAKALGLRLRKKYGDPTRKNTGLFYQGVGLLTP